MAISSNSQGQPELANTESGRAGLRHPFKLLEEGIYSALETYSNVHRGSGQRSMITTHLFEEARNLVLEYLGLTKRKFVVIFCSPWVAEIIRKHIPAKDCRLLSSEELGLSIGVRALVVNKKSLPAGTPYYSGGGTTKLISTDWVIWAAPPARFEAGTPAIINVITFVRALQLIKKYGKDIFNQPADDKPKINEILYSGDYEKLQGIALLNRLRKERIGRNLKVTTINGETRSINFDNSASTPTFAPVWNVFRQSLHLKKSCQQELIQEVRKTCAAFLHAPLSGYDLIFTSNTTEALNLAAENLRKRCITHDEPIVLNTLLEHSSNDLPWRMISQHSVIKLSVDHRGFIDLVDLENRLAAFNSKIQRGKKRVKLVAVSGASNVLGVCPNIEQISNIVHNYGADLLVDAAQLAAHRKIDMKASGIDYLAFSAHKVYAPFGCGVLMVKKGLLNFNHEELALIKSSGEENIAGIAAMGSALALLLKVGMEQVESEEKDLATRLLNGLDKLSGCEIYGIEDPNSPEFERKIGVIPFNMKGMVSFKVGKELANKSGIGVRVGCHCAHILVKHIMHVGPGLERFQRILQTLIPGFSFPGVVRVSLGLENTVEDVNKLLIALGRINAKSTDSPGNAGNIKSQMRKYVDSILEKVYSIQDP